MSEVLIALKEAKETLNRLLIQYPIGSTTRRIELNNDCLLLFRLSKNFLS